MSKTSKNAKNQMVTEAYLKAFQTHDLQKIDILEKKFSKHIDVGLMGQTIDVWLHDKDEHKEALFHFYKRVAHHRRKIEDWAIEKDIVEFWQHYEAPKFYGMHQELLTTSLRHKRFHVLCYLTDLFQGNKPPYPQPDDGQHPDPIHTQDWLLLKEGGYSRGLDPLRLSISIGDERSFEFLAARAKDAQHIAYAVSQRLDLKKWVFCPVNRPILKQRLGEIGSICSRGAIPFASFVAQLKEECPDVFYDGLELLLSKREYQLAELFVPYVDDEDEILRIFKNVEASEQDLKKTPHLKSMYERQLLRGRVQTPESALSRRRKI